MPPSSSRLHTRWETVAGRRIFARVSDDRPPGSDPIVLVHGFGVAGRYLVPTAELLARRHCVAVPDLPGWGRSAAPGRALSLPELADVLAGWMTALDLPRAALLGHSFGCQVVVELALRHPERVRCAVLVGPTGDPARRSLTLLLARLAADTTRERPSQVAITLRDYRRFGLRRGLATARTMVADPIVEKLPRVTVPTLVVRGDRDTIVAPRWTERVAALLPAGEAAVVPGAAHAVPYDAPAALTARVERFLAAHAGAP